jgi:pimeloyl-ACP methyl ester carboxylesterase
MKTINYKNHTFVGASKRLSLIDLVIPTDFNGKMILFIHGFMGYKDWGAWNLMQDFFTSKGFGFCKYNVSHNGTTVENPCEFVDLKSFSLNSYTKELEDLTGALNWLSSELKELPKIYLVGHSRGGGIALLGAKDERVYRIVTLAAIASIEKRFPEGKQLQVWQTQGTKYTLNGRTNQKMPQLFAQYEDFIENREIFDIQKACENSSKRTLVIHGDADTSVSIDEGHEIAQWLRTRLFEIEEATHTFGAEEPWKAKQLPNHLEKVCELIIGFLLIED